MFLVLLWSIHQLQMLERAEEVKEVVVEVDPRLPQDLVLITANFKILDNRDLRVIREEEEEVGEEVEMKLEEVEEVKEEVEEEVEEEEVKEEVEEEAVKEEVEEVVVPVKVEWTEEKEEDAVTANRMKEREKSIKKIPNF